eukprot:5479042-Alexandrium_andersonii.AAC.1
MGVVAAPPHVQDDSALDRSIGLLLHDDGDAGCCPVGVPLPRRLLRHAHHEPQLLEAAHLDLD